MVRQGIASAAAALPGLISSVWGFTTALLANPVTWIVIGIAALTAGLILLWKNWDKVSAFIQNVWNACVEKYGRACRHEGLLLQHWRRDCLHGIQCV